MKTLNLQKAAILLSICVLASCASPRETSQSLTRKILKQLPVPNRATLLHISEFERVSKTGMGTHFGVEGLYGSNAEYNHILEEYRDLLTVQGWQKDDHLENQLRFRSLDYKAVEIVIANVAGFEEDYADILAEVSEDTLREYSTLYVVNVSHYPFD
jgi:hypothetical protein